MSTDADRPLIRLLPGRDKRVKAGHPWAFSNEIAMTAAAKALPPGSVVRLEGDDGVKHGAWHFNPHSLIAARLLTPDPQAAIDAGWFRARLGACLALRQRLFDAPFYRLVHAEADGLPGLIIDRYGDAIALQANTAGMEAATPLLVEALRALLNPDLIVGRNDAGVRVLEGLPEQVVTLHGEPRRVFAEEGGLRFPVDLTEGQKTGWFHDQREHRARVARLAKDATVLDAFCHTGGFGLQAAAAGASRVTLLDRSALALELAMEAAQAHGLADRVETRRGDAMEELARIEARFDIVIADPPAFAKARKDNPAALRAYGKLARLAAERVARGGFLFIASCSHHVAPGEFADAVLWGVDRAHRRPRILHQGGAGPDHPLHPMLPESAYLKGMLLHLP
ncbi:class I SAM-dependent rRNA methyltransferase [Roseomonas hellenica]|uniref:Class I SAM-dependent rRNA methyltransferase n=1 Tax=Plastoroseomonas hellenica TaxID=2687306 RepID=A0ABS5F0X7_9PROT|nr:class I SAM-dependent rRNA methyltransferase [Plastoroseomonas hellenica]MBR0666199.1 class I SAM-dependent rRNA methyltransferase [Plastoroseomonas hellenica]